MSIQPFAEQGHYTAVHDAIFDVVMPKCPPNAWKVLCYIIRKTRGWQKEQDSLPYRQIKEGAGINSDTTVSKALNWLVANDLIVANAQSTENGRWRASSYGLNRGYSLEYDAGPTPDSGNSPTPQTGAEPTPENEVGPTPDSVPLKNHTVRQEPEDKKQVSPEGAETSSANQKSNQSRARPSDPYKGNFYVDMLKNSLDAAKVDYPDRQKGKFARAVGAKLKDGVGPDVLIPATARMIERIPEWPEMELADALTDIRRGSGKAKRFASDNVTQIRSRNLSEEPATEAELRHRQEDAERLAEVRRMCREFGAS